MKESLLKALLELTPAERIELAEALWDSIGPAEMPPLTPEQRQELDRRLADHERDPSTAVPWEEVLVRLRSRVG
jgi:putative addiction module component (TIGR02574 family)